jgi:arylsulfatase
MNRRSLIRNAILGAGAIGTTGLGAQEESGAKAPRDRASERGIPGSPQRKGNGAAPNIFSICTDQQRFDTIQGLSNSVIKTPNLQKFVGESVIFTNTFVQTPICSPSRGT